MPAARAPPPPPSRCPPAARRTPPSPPRAEAGGGSGGGGGIAWDRPTWDGGDDEGDGGAPPPTLAPLPPPSSSARALLAALSTTLASATTVWSDCVFPRPADVARLTVGVLAAAAGLVASVAGADAAAALWYRRAAPALREGVGRALDGANPFVRWERRRRLAGKGAGAAARRAGGVSPALVGERLGAPAALQASRRPAAPAFGVRRPRGWAAFEALG